MVSQIGGTEDSRQEKEHDLQQISDQIKGLKNQISDIYNGRKTDNKRRTELREKKKLLAEGLKEPRSLEGAIKKIQVEIGRVEKALKQDTEKHKVELVSKYRKYCNELLEYVNVISLRCKVRNPHLTSPQRSRILILTLTLKGLFLYTGGVLFHVEWCIR